MCLQVSSAVHQTEAELFRVIAIHVIQPHSGWTDRESERHRRELVPVTIGVILKKLSSCEARRLPSPPSPPAFPFR